jgi:enoyl-CoA hydratase/carnithine racemase
MMEPLIHARVGRAGDFKEGPRAFAENRKPVWKGQ